jgi:hypothetical protein
VQMKGMVAACGSGVQRHRDIPRKMRPARASTQHGLFPREAVASMLVRPLRTFSSETCARRDAISLALTRC